MGTRVLFFEAQYFLISYDAVPPMLAKVLASSFLLVFSSAFPALADVVPISANQQISASGGYSCFSPVPPCPIPSGSFSVGDSSQTLGLYDQTRSGSATGLGGGNSSVVGNVAQTSNTTSDAITLNTDGNVMAGGLFQMGILFGNTSSLFSVQFMLPSASVVNIFGNATLSAGMNGIISPTSPPTATGSQSMVLTGPGVNFAPSIADLSVTFPFPSTVVQSVPFGSTLTLLPGVYTFEATSNVGFLEGLNFSGSLLASFDMSVTADFTPAVPEPSPAVPVLVAMVVAIYWRMRRRVRA
jgi:hypothetical protein